MIIVESEDFLIDNFEYWQNFEDSLKSIPGVEEVYQLQMRLTYKR